LKCRDAAVLSAEVSKDGDVDGTSETTENYTITKRKCHADTQGNTYTSSA